MFEIGCVIVFGLFFGVGFWARQCEKKDWNGGICPDCGRTWKAFDMDSQGGRGYSCYTNLDQYSRRCDRTIWISYPGVDKSYREGKGKS